MKLNPKRQLLFGTYTYFERLGWFLIQILPKFLRKIIFKIIFGSFGKNVSIDEFCYFRYPWKIFISDNVTINRGCEFYPSFAFSDSKITLGQGVTVGPRVIFFGAGHDPISANRPDISESIDVKAGAYIGGNTTVCYGNTIGENSVIGAGSVVVSDVTPNTIFAGNPAVFKKLILS
jgi:acetyltransferase-like isoleucine patch superfamily enzyme